MAGQVAGSSATARGRHRGGLEARDRRGRPRTAEGNSSQPAPVKQLLAHILDCAALHGRRHQAVVRHPPPLQLQHRLAQEGCGLVALWKGSGVQGWPSEKGISWMRLIHASSK